MEIGKIGNEIVPDQKPKQDPVINDTLDVELEVDLRL